MGFVERRDVSRPASGEAPFHAHETFFSHTNDRGIIQSGNYVFQRVAAYDWETLIGAPHKIIRHPDMPKGVFWLFWDTLKKGLPIGAYVKNKARDGLHYWVFAVAMPFGDGFLSVRIKPCSGILKQIERQYDELRTAELENGVSPKESADSLLEWVKSQGHADYASFESHALAEELLARDRVLKNPPEEGIVHFRGMISAAQELLDQTLALSNRFDAISTIPTNMRIIASRLEPSGGAITALSQNYWSMSEEMSNWFRSFVNNSGSDFAALHSTLEGCRFLTCTARILTEAADQFARERRSLGSIDIEREKQQISALAATYVRKATKGLHKVTEEAQRISGAITIMRRYTLGLSSTRVMCNIESARLPVGGETLANIIDQLGNFQVTIDHQLSRIDDLSRDIQLQAAFLETA